MIGPPDSFLLSLLLNHSSCILWLLKIAITYSSPCSPIAVWNAFFFTPLSLLVLCCSLTSELSIVSLMSSTIILSEYEGRKTLWPFLWSGCQCLERICSSAGWNGALLPASTILSISIQIPEPMCLALIKRHMGSRNESNTRHRARESGEPQQCTFFYRPQFPPLHLCRFLKIKDCIVCCWDCIVCCRDIKESIC